MYEMENKVELTANPIQEQNTFTESEDFSIEIALNSNVSYTDNSEIIISE